MSDRSKALHKRKIRVRRSLRLHSKDRPRLSVFRSSKQIYAQIIDDQQGITLVSASTLDKTLKSSLKTGADIEAAKTVGKEIAERAIQKGISTVVFDRSGYMYHGRIKALADSARQAGLVF